jgi:hypothetical protein
VNSNKLSKFICIGLTVLFASIFCTYAIVAHAGHTETSAICASEPLTPPAWLPNTIYVFGQRVSNDGGKVYQMISRTSPTDGRSASSGGPTGTGASIIDGGLIWAYAMPAATGKVYYVCDCGTGSDSRCVNGDDTRSSTQAQNPDTPWRTLEKARTQFYLLNAGDTVALCRGGVFVQQNDNQWSNLNCTASNNCILRDYSASWDTNGSAALPVILSISGRSRAFPFGANSGIRIENINIKTTSGVMWGLGLSSHQTDLTLCNIMVEGFNVGLQDDCGDNVPTTTRTVVLGSKFLNNTGQGILAGGDGTIIADNYFDRNGSEAVFDHSIYLSNHAATATTMKVIGNEIYRNTLQSNGKCDAVVIVAHGKHRNTIIEGNLIDSSSIAAGNCWGISLSPGGYGMAEYFRNAIIRKNRIFGVGSAGINADMCTNCLIENNLIVVDGNGSGGSHAITAPSLVWTAPPSDPSDHSGNITIRNNTVFFTSGATTGDFRGITSINDGDNHVISNNAFSWFGSGGTFICFNLSGSYDAVTNNACYGGTIGYAEAVNTITAAPQYTSPGCGAGYDFTPAAGSPLINSGSAIYYSPTDLTGQARDDWPDIGAFEYAGDCANLPVRINNIAPGYSTIPAAYAAASTGQTINMRETTFSGPLSLSDNFIITLKGGYNCDFTSNDGYSTIAGKMTISDGAVKITNVIIK